MRRSSGLGSPPRHDPAAVAVGRVVVHIVVVVFVSLVGVVEMVVVLPFTRGKALVQWHDFLQRRVRIRVQRVVGRNIPLLSQICVFERLAIGGVH